MEHNSAEWVAGCSMLKALSLLAELGCCVCKSSCSEVQQAVHLGGCVWLMVKQTITSNSRELT